jgi:hypothetical protein
LLPKHSFPVWGARIKKLSKSLAPSRFPIYYFPRMAKRKTVSLESIKLKANHYFTTSKNEATLQRRTLQFFVTDLLMDAGQYRGFNYLRKHDVENGLTYGVEWNDTGDKATFKDESRIFFH